MPNLAFEPLRGDVVTGRDLLKLSPQIVILDGLSVCSAPVVGFPVRQPFGNALGSSLSLFDNRQANSDNRSGVGGEASWFFTARFSAGVLVSMGGTMKVRVHRSKLSGKREPCVTFAASWCPLIDAPHPSSYGGAEALSHPRAANLGLVPTCRIA